MMDKNNFMNMMKSIQNMLHCPSCGSVYEVEEMQFVGHGDGYFLLSLTCSKCSLPVWINVFSGPSGIAAPVTDLSINDIAFLDKDPISGNEVIDLHLLLKSFDGDFKKAFSRRA